MKRASTTINLFLTPLVALTTVGENLYIDGRGLTSLEGLHNLTGGDELTVSNLPNINSVTGLSGLTSPGSKLMVAIRSAAP